MNRHARHEVREERHVAPSSEVHQPVSGRHCVGPADLVLVHVLHEQCRHTTWQRHHCRSASPESPGPRPPIQPEGPNQLGDRRGRPGGRPPRYRRRRRVNLRFVDAYDPVMAFDQIAAPTTLAGLEPYEEAPRFSVRERPSVSAGLGPGRRSLATRDHLSRVIRSGRLPTRARRDGKFEPTPTPARWGSDVASERVSGILRVSRDAL